MRLRNRPVSIAKVSVTAAIRLIASSRPGQVQVHGEPPVARRILAMLVSARSSALGSRVSSTAVASAISSLVVNNQTAASRAAPPAMPPTKSRTHAVVRTAEIV